MDKDRAAVQATSAAFKALTVAAMFLIMPTAHAATGQVCNTPNAAIADGNPFFGAFDFLNSPQAGALVDLNVYVEVEHTRVGDLTFRLLNTFTGTEIVFVDRPGLPGSGLGCTNADFAAVLDDEAATDVEDQCAATPPAIGGTHRPNSALSAFDGQAINRLWNIFVADNASGETGTLITWCLNFETDLPPDCAEMTNIFVDNQWQLFSLPCGIGAANTVADIFTANGNFDAGSYLDGSAGTWVVYERDAVSDDYRQLELTDTMETGRGYWVKTLDAARSVTQASTANAEQGRPVVSGAEVTLCSNPAVGIPDNVPAGINDLQTIGLTGVLADLDVSVAATHTDIQDLIFSVEHVGTGTSVNLFNQECAGENNLDLIFDDAAIAAVGAGCAEPYSGTFQPVGTLADFNGENLSGDWSLTISDNAGGESGTLDEWCLRATTQELGSRLNMIGNPYEVDVDWADAMVDDNGTLKTLDEADPLIGPTRACSMVPPDASCVASSTAWKWDGNGYQPMSPSTPMLERTLSGFDGYWVDIYKPGVEIVLPRPVARLPVTDGQTTPRVQQPQQDQRLSNDWHIRLIAESGNLRDAGNVFGQSADSLDGYDHRDLVELAPFGSPYLTVVFPHPEWLANGEAFATDFRALQPGKSGEWAFSVRSAGISESVTLSWEGPDKALRAAVLIDLATGMQVKAGFDGSYTFVPQGTESQFLWRQLPW